MNGVEKDSIKIEKDPIKKVEKASDDFMKSITKPKIDLDSIVEKLNKNPNNSLVSFMDKKTSRKFDLSDYGKYLFPEHKDSSYSFPFQATLDKDRAEMQSNWEQAGHVVAKIIPNTALEFLGMLGNTLDVEDYINSDKEVGNWLNNWTRQKKQDINKALPIYRENPQTALDIGDFAWWMENGSSLAESAAAFVALGYITGGGSLKALTKGAKALEWLKVLGEGKAVSDTGLKATHVLAGLANTLMLNQAEGIGIATDVYNTVKQQKYDQYLREGKNHEEATSLANKDAAKAGSTSLNTNRANILLNLTSAFAFIKAPTLTRGILKAPTMRNSLNKVLYEGFQEAGEEVVNQYAQNKGTYENYTLRNFKRDAFTAQMAEQALLGFVGGAGQTIMTNAGRLLPMYKNNEGNRVSRNYLQKERYYAQQESNKRWEKLSKEDKIKESTDVYNRTEDNIALYKSLQDAQKAGNTDKVQTIKNTLLRNQAYDAFATSSTDALIDIFKGISKLSSDEAEAKGLNKDTYVEDSNKAINTINVLEKEYNKSQDFIDKYSVYENRADAYYLKNYRTDINTAVDEVRGEVIQDLKDIEINEENIEIKDNGRIFIKNLKELPKQKQEIIKNLNSFNLYKDRIKELSRVNKSIENNIKEYAYLTSDGYKKEVQTKINDVKKDIAKKEKEKAKVDAQKEYEEEKKKKRQAFKKDIENPKSPPIKTEVQTKETIKEPSKNEALVFDFGKEHIALAEKAQKNYDSNATTETKIDWFQKMLDSSEKLPDDIKRPFILQYTNALKKLHEQLSLEQSKDTEKQKVTETVDNTLNDLASDLTADEAPSFSEKSNAINSRINKMLKALDEMSALGIDVNDFINVAVFAQQRLGKAKFIAMFDKFQSLYNLTNVGKTAKYSYEDIFYTPEQKEAVEISGKADITNTLLSGLYDVTSEEYKQSIDDVLKDSLREEGYSLYTNDIKDFEGLKLTYAPSTLAYLAKDYVTDVKVFTTDKFNRLIFNVSKRDLNNIFNNTLDEVALDFNQINTGSQVTLKVLDEVVYKDGTIAYGDGRLEQNGKIISKDPIENAPIGVIYKGKVVRGLFLHLPNWINESTIADAKEVETQQAQLRHLRETIINTDTGSINTTVTNRSNGHLMIDTEGKLSSVKQNLPKAKIAIGKDNLLNRGENIIYASNLNEVQDGWTYAYFDVNKEVKYAVPVHRITLKQKPEIVNSILNVVELYLDNNAENPKVKDLFKLTGINILNIEGLRKYLSKYIYLNPNIDFKYSAFKSLMENASETQAVVRIAGDNLEFGMGMNLDDSIGFINRTIINRDPNRNNIIKALKSKLKTVLENSRLNVDTNLLGKSFDNIIIEDEVKKDTINYEDFIKENTNTSVYSIALEDGTEIYTAQANIKFNTNFAFEQIADTKTEKEQEDIATNIIKDSDLGIGLDNLEDYDTDVELSPFIERSNIVKYFLRSINILNSERAKEIFVKGKKNNWNLNKILTELQVPKVQKQIILDKDITDREDIITSLLADNSFVVEVNTAKNEVDGDRTNYWFENPNYFYSFDSDTNKYYKWSKKTHPTYTPLETQFEISKKQYFKELKESQIPTQYYSNLTVPGGTNYVENEIATPDITPSIKGHAKFSTDNGIGWFRSDEADGKSVNDNIVKSIKEVPNEFNFSGEKVYKESGEWYYGNQSISDESALFKYNQSKGLINNEASKNTKTRRILEVQSDLFQKGRNNNKLTKLLSESENIDERIKSLNSFENRNNFLQLLNKKNNWVTFFVKSIIQDSAKKGYEKVLFPTGSTAAKVEGHETIADEIAYLNQIITQVKETPDRYKTSAGYFEESKYSIIGEDLDNFIVMLELKKKEFKDTGLEKLKPIEAFYTNRVTNILNKLYNVNQVTDEYDNTWNEVSLKNIKDYIELSPLTLNEDNIDKFKQDTPPAFSIQGISLPLQTEIIDHLTYNIIKDATKNNYGNLSLDHIKNFKASLDEAITVLDNRINGLSKEEQNKINALNKAKNIIKGVTNNYGILTKLVLDRLRSYNNLRVNDKAIELIKEAITIDEDNEFDLLDIIEDNKEDTSNWNDLGVFMSDPRDKISIELKNFLSSIEDVVGFETKDGKITAIPKTSNFFRNMVIPVPFDRLYNELSGILAYDNFNTTENVTAPDFDSMIKILEEWVETKPYIFNVIKELKNANEVIKNKFVTAMSKHYTNHVYGFKNKKGNIIIGNSDGNAVVRVIQQHWYNNIINSPLITVTNEKEYVYNEEEINKINKDAEVLMTMLKTNADENLIIAKANDVLTSLGFDFGPALIKDIKTNGIRYSKSPYSLIHLFGNSDGIFKILLKNLNKFKGLRLEEHHPFSDNSALNKFTRIIARRNPVYFANSFRDVRSRLYWSYSNNKFLIDRFRHLKTNKELINKLANQPYSKNSDWVKALVKGDKNFLNHFQYFTVDGLNFVYRNGKKLNQLSPAEYEQLKTGFFFSQNKKGDNYIVNLYYPTLSDKTIQYGIKVLGTKYSDMLAPQTGFNITDQMVDVMFDKLVQPEIDRILIEQQSIESTIEGRKEGGKMFLHIPTLNAVPELWTKEHELKANINYNEQIKDAAKRNLKAYLNRTVTQKFNKWLEYGFAEEKEDYDANGNPFIIKINKDTKNPLIKDAIDYTFNYLVGNVNVYQTFATDPANYWKSEHWQEVANTVNESGLDEEILTREQAIKYYTVQDWLQEHEDTFDNMGKRRASDSAPGLDVTDSTTSTIQMAVISDRVRTSDFIKEYQELIKDLPYDFKGTDAQEFTTLKEHLTVMNKKGELSIKEMNRLLRLDAIGQRLSLEDRKIILNPHKLVGVYNVWENGIERRIYVKGASIPLLKSLTKGLEIDKLRKAMEKQNIDRVPFASAVKVGAANINEIWGEDGTINITELKTIKNDGTPILREGLKIQQEIPIKNVQRITDGSQPRKLLTSNFRGVKGFKIKGKEGDFTGQQIQDEFDKTYERIYRIKYNQLIKDLDYNIVNNEIGNLEKLENILISEGIARKYNINELSGLKIVNGKFETPLWLNSISSKIEPLLNSIVDNNIRKLKFKGNSYTLGTSEGFYPIKTGEKATDYMNNTTNIIYDKAWFNSFKEGETRRLRPIRIENGEVKADEILVPFKITTVNGDKINMSDYVEKTPNGMFIDTNKLPKELLEGFGFRIPTSGNNLMTYFKVVGFLPEASGDILLAPSEWVVRMGSDFDADKLFSYLYNVDYDKQTKKLSRYRGENELETLQDYLLDLRISIMSNPSKAVQSEIVRAISYGNLVNKKASTDLVREIYPYVDKSTKGIGITEEYQTTKYKNARAGDAGIGVFSNDSAFNALLKNTDIKLVYQTKEGERNVSFIIGNKRSNFLSNPTTITGKYKSEIIEAFQTLSVDNENEQGLHKLNINKHTFDTIKTLIFSGYDDTMIATYLNQPIIRRYVELKDNVEDTAIEFTTEDLNKIIDEEFPQTDKLNQEYDLSFNTMMENIKNPPNTAAFYNNQRLLLDKLTNPVYGFDKYGKIIKKLQSTINTDSAGIGKDLFYTTEKENQILDLPINNNVYNAEKLLGEYITLTNNPTISFAVSEDNEVNNTISNWVNLDLSEEEKTVEINKLLDKGYVPISPIKSGERINSTINLLKPNNINGFASAYGLMLNNTLWSKYFPYNDTIIKHLTKELRNTLNRKTETIAERAAQNKTIFNSIKSFLISNKVNTFTDGNVFEERNRLFLDTKTNVSLANIIKTLKDEGKLSNDFINRLNFDINKEVLFSNIVYKANMAENVDERGIFAAFTKMFLDTTPLGVFNNITYTPQKIAQDLVTHQFISGGIQKANQFIKYIPMSYLKSIGYYEVMENIEFNNHDDFNTDAYKNQYLQHYPKEVLLSDTKKSLINGKTFKYYNNATIIRHLNGDEYLPSVFSVEDSTTLKGYRIYFFNIEANQWEQKDTLGRNDILEYNGNKLFGNTILTLNKVKEPTKITLPKDIKEIDVTLKMTTPKEVTEGEIVYDPTTATIVEKFNLNVSGTSSEKMVNILQQIITNDNNTLNSYLAQELVNNIEKIKDYRFIIDTNLDASGQHSIYNKTITINPTETETEEDFESVVLEELIHAFTKKAIIENKQGEVLRLKSLRKEAINAVKKMIGENADEKIKTVENKLLSKDPLTREELDIIYPILSDEEFIGRLLLSKNLQKILNETPTKENKSLLTKVFDFIKNLLDNVGIKVNDDSVLAYAVTDIISLIKQPPPSSSITGKLQQQKNVTRTVEWIEKRLNLKHDDGTFVIFDDDVAEEHAKWINTNISNLEAVAIYGAVKVSDVNVAVPSGQQLNLFEANVPLEEFINHSGGATGADSAWEIIGKKFGMSTTKHYYVEGNKTPRGNTSITQKEAIKADKILEKANKALKRKFPTSNEYVNNLLRRNWYQVKNSDAVFAIGNLPGNTLNTYVEGGTGWAVQMAKDIGKPVFVFNQKDNNWYTFDDKGYFVRTITPKLTKNFAGIGSRDLTEAGKQAIKDVYSFTKNIQTDLAPRTGNILSPLVQSLNNRIYTLQKNIDKAERREEQQKVAQLQEQLSKLINKRNNVLTKSRVAEAATVGRQDMQEIEEMFKHKITIEDALYIRKIVNFWKTSKDTILEEKHKKSEQFLSMFDAIISEAIKHETKLEHIENDYMQKLLSKYGVNMSIEDIFLHFKDINSLSENLLDISRVDNAMLSSIYMHVKKANNNATDEVTNLLSNFEKIESKIKKTLKARGDKELYDVYRQRTPSGKITGHLVNRYSYSFTKDLKKYAGTLKSKPTQFAYKKLIDWAKDNTKNINLNYIVPENTYKEGEEEKAKVYREELKKELGENHYNAFIKEQTKMLNAFHKSKQGYLDFLMNDYSGVNTIEELFDIKEAFERYAWWLTTNSPYVLYKQFNKEKIQFGGKDAEYKNVNYIKFIPNKDKYYDNNFKSMEADKDLYDFYNYFNTVDKELRQYLPVKDRIGLAINGIPHIEKVLLEQYQDKGMKVGLLPIWDAIKTSIRKNEEGIVDYTNRDPVTETEEKELGVNLTRNNRQAIIDYIRRKKIAYTLENPKTLTSELKVKMEEWREEIVDILAQKKSYDLPKVLRVYALTTIAFKHKAKIEDVIKLSQNILNRQKEFVRNNRGELKEDEAGRYIPLNSAQSFKKLKKQFDYFIDTFYGDVRDNEGVGKRKILTSEDKAKQREINDLLVKLKANFDAGIIKAEDYDTQKNSLQQQLDRLGGVGVWSRRGDALLKFVQLKGMGWNLMSAIANVGFGYISNIIEGSGGQIYNNKQLYKGYSLVMGSILRNATFNKITTEQAGKIRVLMDKWDVLKDASKELFQSPLTIVTSNKTEWLAPYNLTQRTEYVNQAPNMIAMMLATDYEVNGKKINLWEAYDENGDWKTNEYGEEPKDLISNFRVKLDQVIKMNHGNYDPNSPIAIKKKFWGRALSQFRSWMYEGFATRWEGEKYDKILEITRKGRYRSLADFFREVGVGEGTLAILKGFIRSGSFGTVFGNADFSKYQGENFSETDVANMRKAMTELLLLTSVYSANLMLLSLSGKLDEEDDKKKLWLVNTLFNQGLRLKMDILLYLNPKQFKNILRDLIPATSVVTDFIGWADAVRRFTQGEDEIKHGVYSGHSRLLRETAQMLPFGTQVYKNINYSVQTFDK